MDFGHYIGLLDIIWRVLNLRTLYRESCGLWKLHRVIGHHMACFRPMDFI